MRVLVACEESQAVTIEFRKLGHEAYSCDILPCSGGHPEWHLQQDVVPLLDETWDMVLAFPPCTHLCVSGARWFSEKRADGRQFEAFRFFMQFTYLNHIPKVAIENPIGVMSKWYRKPDQYIQPYEFGDDASKTTCLWLKGLPRLRHTNYAEPHYRCKCGHNFEYTLGKYGCPNCCGEHIAKLVFSNQTCSGQNNVRPGPEQARIRSRTFPGIAKAMAEQWGGLA
jgi:hypothetical protein